MSAKFKDTHLFRTEAIKYLENFRNGKRGPACYCPYPQGTVGWKEYWDEQTKRCTEGYEVNGVKVTGLHYAYLNFAQIERVSEKAKKKTGRARSEISFPDFWDGDYEYFWAVEKAKDAGKHLIVAKSRRKGFSFKNAFMAAHQYNFERDSRAIISSYMQGYSDNTMGMCLDYLNFFNEATAWRKNRLPDTKTFVRAAFEEMDQGVKVTRGYKSEIESITFKDNPFKSIGKGVRLFLIDEAGKFPNLKATWMFTKPTLESGDNTVGLAIIFGTGGDMESGSVDFAEMFYNPDTYGFMAYDNRWDEDAIDTKCGYFFPDYQNREGHIDADGNSIVDTAIESQLIQREIIKKNAKTRHTLTQYISQWPFSPREAFLRGSGNLFPAAELGEWLAKLEGISETGEVGELILQDANKVKFMPRADLKAIENYPLKPDDDKEGAIIIWEHPDSVPVSNLYIAGCDPIDQDEAETSDSLGSVFIYKKMFSATETYHRVVAEFTGRPSTFNGGAQKFYETVRRLLLYYNARCLYENQLKGLKTYFQQKQSLHLLTETPTIIADRKIIKKSVVNRGYGIHMTPDIKKQGELYIADWLVQPVVDMDGSEILRLHTIRSKALLKELINYDPDPKKSKNYDRVIAFMLCMFQNEQDYDIKPQTMSARIYNDPFWSQKLRTSTIRNATNSKIAPF